ncbi:MAG: hypothetical protein WA821_07335 [Anaerolineales bacterium]
MSSNNFAMMVRVRGDVSVKQVKAALSKVRVRHPALIPAAGADQDAFFPLAVRAGCGENDWIEAARAELRELFPEPPGPFARFTLLQRAGGFDLVAAFHHHFSDGMSGMFVLRDILQALGDPEAVLVPIPVPPPTGAAIPEAVLSNPGLRRKVVLTMAALRARVLLEKLRRRFSPPKQTPAPETSAGNLSAQQQFVILPARLTAEQTAALVARCKKEGVSVHAAVCVAWLRAFTAGAQGVKRFETVSSPVNLRQRLSPPVDDTSGMFMAIVETHVDCAPERDFWDAAREFKQKLTRDSRDEALFFMPLMFSKIFTQVPAGDREIVGRMLFGGPVAYDFSITNLGRVALPERSGDLQVEAFYGPLVNSSPYERTVGVSTLGGQMSIVLLFRRSMMETDKGRELMERAINCIKVVCQPKSD